MRFRRRDLSASEHALLAADESHQLAEHQLEQVKDTQGSSKRMAQALREHSEANHFDDWLLNRVLGER